MLNPDDARSVVVPFLSIASKDESAEDHAKFAENLKVEKRVETFDDQIHGFMTARADLEAERSREEYERGYKILLEFFAAYLCEFDCGHLGVLGKAEALNPTKIIASYKILFKLSSNNPRSLLIL
jgi:hypothetical protein